MADPQEGELLQRIPDVHLGLGEDRVARPRVEIATTSDGQRIVPAVVLGVDIDIVDLEC